MFLHFFRREKKGLSHSFLSYWLETVGKMDIVRTHVFDFLKYDDDERKWQKLLLSYYIRKGLLKEQMIIFTSTSTAKDYKSGQTVRRR